MTKTKHKILSVFLSLCMIISCMVGMSVTASAGSYNNVTWSENQHFESSIDDIDTVTVNADITVTIDENVIVTVNRGIIAEGKTITVAGKGTLVVNGTNGAPGNNGEEYGSAGDNGGNGITGNVIVNGATVTVTGGTGGTGGDGSSSNNDAYGGVGGIGGFGIEGNLTVNSGTATVTGGNGGEGGEGSSGEGEGYGGNGGDGDVGVFGNVTVTGGSATVTGGSGGSGGEGSVSVGSSGGYWYAVYGEITGSAQESDDNSTWFDVSGTSSDKRYVKIDPAPLPAWENGDFIAILDDSGTAKKLTVAKKDGATTEAWGTGWTPKSPNTTAWTEKRATITEVEIQDGVTSIGSSAFYYCSALPSVTIPSSVTSIGISAFESCTSLTSVDIPSSVTSIGNSAFYNCKSLTSVSFEPVSETDAIAGKTLAIDEDAFLDTKSGATVAYGTGNTVLYDDTTEIKAGDALTKIYSTEEDKTLTWKAPDAVAWTNGNVIGILDGTKLTVAKKSAEQPGAMENNGWTAVGSAPAWDEKKETITEVEIQDGVTSIGQGAFNKCAFLTSVTIPSSVTSIGLGAFNSCTSLTSVTIPSGVTSIGENAFLNCSALTSVTIPSGVTSIGEYAFCNCSALATVTFEPRSASDIATNKELDIGGNAFTNTAEGAKIAYGLGVSSLYYNDNIIEKDSVLTIISSQNLEWKVDNNVKAWTNGNVIGVLEEEGDVKKLIVGKKASATTEAWGTGWEKKSPNETTWDTAKGTITELEIQDSVTSIGDKAFSGCSKLTSVNIPNSVTRIGDSAFDDCSALTSVTISSKVTSIGSAAFNYCESLTSVTFNPGTADATLSIAGSAFYGAEDAKVAYGTGDTVLFDGDTEITAGTALTKIQYKELTWKAKPAPAPDPEPEPDPEPDPDPDPEPDKYTLTFDFNGGGSAVYYIEAGEELADYIPEIGQEGYTFLGWDKLIPDTMPENDLTFKAMWKINQYTVTFNTDGGSAVESITLDYNEIITVPAAPTKEGYTFSGWYDLPTRMPARDITVKAKWTKEPDIGPHPVIPANATPSQTTTTTTTTPSTTPTKVSIAAEQTEDNSTGLSWDSVPGASSYSIYVKTADGYKLLQKTSKRAVDVIYTTSGKYYVSDGGSYTIYKYKNGSFVKVGTASESKAAKVTKANNVTVDFMVKYTKNGVLSTDEQSLKASQKIYYKPAVKLTAKKGSIVIKWDKVPGAEKYRVFKLVNDKLRLVTETEKHNILITGTKAGKEYSYAVKALVDGEWTAVCESDMVSVTAK